MRAFFSEYIFLLSGLYLFSFWLILFFLFRKNEVVTKRMLIISLAFMILTPILEWACLIDWWQPTFLSENLIHIEDILFGFSISGVSFGIFSLINKNKSTHHSWKFKEKIFIIILTILSFLISFYSFKLGSFWASIISMSVFSILILLKTKISIFNLILNGIILIILMIPGYFLGSYLNPGWIQEYWILTGIQSKLFLTIPLAEYIYYILTGFSIPLVIVLLQKENSYE